MYGLRHVQKARGPYRSATGGVAPPAAEVLRHLVMYGQSLSIGSDPNGGSVISPVSSTHYMLASGVRAHIDTLPLGGNINTPIDPDQMLPITAHAESVSSQSPDFGETLCGGIGANLTTRHGFTTTGRGAYRIDQLSREGNGAPSDANHFHNTYAAMLYMSDAAADAGWSYSIPAFGWKQGEADAAAGTSRAQYRAALVQMRDDLRAAAQAAAHFDASSTPMLVDQLAFRADIASSGNGDTATGYGSIAVAVIQAHRAGDVICVGPTYDAGFIDVRDVHFSSQGYYDHGESWAEAVKVVEAGGSYHPCHITSASRAGTTITLTVHTPVAPLVKDTATFASRAFANDGFDYDGANITAVTITDDGSGTNIATIEITLDADAGGVLRYAYENAAVDQRNLVGGHIKDSSAGARIPWLCTDEWSLT